MQSAHSNNELNMYLNAFISLTPHDYGISSQTEQYINLNNNESRNIAIAIEYNRILTAPIRITQPIPQQSLPIYITQPIPQPASQQRIIQLLIPDNEPNNVYNFTTTCAELGCKRKIRPRSLYCAGNICGNRNINLFLR